MIQDWPLVGAKPVQMKLAIGHKVFALRVFRTIKDNQVSTDLAIAQRFNGAAVEVFGGFYGCIGPYCYSRFNSHRFRLGGGFIHRDIDRFRFWFRLWLFSLRRLWWRWLYFGFLDFNGGAQEVIDTFHSKRVIGSHGFVIHQCLDFILPRASDGRHDCQFIHVWFVDGFGHIRAFTQLVSPHLSTRIDHRVDEAFDQATCQMRFEA